MEFGSNGNHHKAKDITILMKCLFGHFMFEKKIIGQNFILSGCPGVAGYMTHA